jgi:hypothetical protein
MRRGQWYEPSAGAGMRGAHLAGTGMVMPTEVICARYDGEDVVLSPDRDLLSTDCEIVLRRPDLFVPALSERLDPSCHERMRDLGGGDVRDPAHPTRTSSTTGGLRLPPADFPTLRLPS